MVYFLRSAKQRCRLSSSKTDELSLDYHSSNLMVEIKVGVINSQHPCIKRRLVVSLKLIYPDVELLHGWIGDLCIALRGTSFTKFSDSNLVK